MARASNSGAPQRVSAHVLPKAPPFSADEEGEKTGRGGGWEEEASTSGEQGEVANKSRAPAPGREWGRRPNTNPTSTNGGSMDELTVDNRNSKRLNTSHMT